MATKNRITLLIILSEKRLARTGTLAGIAEPLTGALTSGRKCERTWLSRSTLPCFP